MANMAKIQPKLDLLPAKPGCYLMKDVNGTIIYVGKAKKLCNRVKSYFHGVHNFKTTKLVENIDDLEYIICDSEKEALIMEINLIKKHTPRFNIMFMDDKSYPYIRLTKGPAPTLSVVRNCKDKNSYLFGPFPNARAAHQTKDLLNKLYPLRKCRHLPKKACLYYHLHQCLAPCIKDIDPKIYEDMAKKIRKFLKGDTKEVIDELTKKMEKFSENLEFEQAQEIKELIDSINYVVSKQNVMFKDQKDRDIFNYYVDKDYISIQCLLIRDGQIINRDLSLSPLYDDPEESFISFILQYYNENSLPSEILLPPLKTDLSEVLDTKIVYPKAGEKAKALEMVYKNAKLAHHNQFESAYRKEGSNEMAMRQLSKLLHKDIHTVELYDNSHINGAFNVSALVVYKDGKPSKKDYRLYKLDEYRSDMDSMKEVVYRRYVRLLKEHKPFNDLLIVDGGKLQIDAVKQVLDALDVHITLCGLVKDDKHNTNRLVDEQGNELLIDKNSSLFFLLTQMQDEVHRRAISYHQKLRLKAQTKSILDEINGLGKVRKKALLKHFGSLKKIKEANKEALMEVVPEKVAENILEFFKKQKD